MMPDTISANDAKSLGWGTPSVQSKTQPTDGLPDTISADQAKSMGWQAPQIQTPTADTTQNKPQGILGSLGSYLKSGGLGALDFTSPILGLAKQVGGNIINQVKGNVKEASQSLSDPNVGVIEGGANIAKNVTSAVLSPITQTVGKAIGTVLNPISNAIEQSQPIQKANDILSKVNPSILGSGADILETGLNVASLGAGGEAPKAIESGIETAKTLPSKMYSVEGVAKDWKKPTEVLNASYNKARNILNTSPETPKFLAQQKLDPKTMLDSAGKYDTTDTAQSLRDTAGQMSHDTLRPSLQVADYSTPKTSVENVIKQTIDNINNQKNITAGDREAQIAKAQSEGEALARKYPEGMSLVNMHDEKISYTSNRYSPVGPKSDSNAANVDRAYGDTLMKQVENGYKPAGDFNKYLSKYYKAADYLESLNTKKAPVSLGSYLANKTARVVGAGFGSKIGGGLLGGVGGYMIGGALEHALENIPNPIRASFIRNLETSNPEAFTKVADYLKNQGGAKGLLQLPKGSPLGTSENPIIPPAPTTYEPQAQQINTEPSKPLLGLPEKAGQGRATSIDLPSSVRETNLGLDEVKNAKINRESTQKDPLRQADSNAQPIKMANKISNIETKSTMKQGILQQAKIKKK